MATMSMVRLAVVLVGLYLVIEGVGSIFSFADQDPLFQVGRIVRVMIGFFLIAVVQGRMN